MAGRSLYKWKRYIKSSIFIFIKKYDIINYKINEKENDMVSNILNKKVIIRGDKSGVFFGTLVAKEGTEVKLEKCRRLWYWEGAASISQIAMEGVKYPEDCKFTVAANEIIITDVIEIIPCTEEAIKILESVKVWKI